MSVSKINLIIFSKDRAAQLHLLLESICSQQYYQLFDVNVLWKASNSEYAEGYGLCKYNWPTARFYEETYSFENETKKLLWEGNEFASFCTDDMVFFRPASMQLLEQLNSGAFYPACVFSFRLGFNTIEQDIHAGTRQAQLHKFVEQDGFLKWNPHDYHPHSNYGYPLAIDTHVFWNSKLDEWLKGFSFKNTNELETLLQRYRHEVSELWSFKHSTSVNIPTNTISGVTRAGEKYSLDLVEANRRYLDGKRLDLNSVLTTKIVGCHQEIELKWVS